MRISRWAVHRPIFTTMVVLIFLILGWVSLRRLPIDLMPDITYPSLSISCAYENASPPEMEELVTRPIEEAMSAVPGVEEVTSISSEGNSNVRVTFSWGTDLDAAANDIRDRLDRVIPRLPDETERPVLRKFDLASFPVLICGASSRLDPIQMRQLIEDQVKYRIERVPGVAALDIWGGLEREIHVDLDAGKVKALQLPLDTILQRIREGNVALPAGTIDRGNLQVTVRTPGEFVDLDQLRDTVVAVREGAAVQLREIARIEDSWQKVSRIIRINGQPGVRLSVNKQSGRNTVEVARGVLAEIEQINRDLPQLNITPIIDTSDYIQRSISNVGSVAMYGGMLAVMVLLVFLRNVRSTAVIATAIPVSIVTTFTLMYFGGFTLNLMSLGGLAMGIGMLVDSSIVVVENIFRLRETGQSPEGAAVAGSEEVSAAIIASTLTTVVVFLPLIFMRGMSGVMFKQLAMVVGFALLCALGAALTLVPMLSARIPPARVPGPNAHERPGRRIYLWTGRFFAAVETGYKGLLHFALSHRWLVVLGAAVLLGGSLALVPRVGVELMPATDEGEVRISAEMAVGTRVDVLDERLQAIASTVGDFVPEVKNMVTSAGGRHWRGSRSHTGDIRIALKPEAERSRSSDDIASDLRRRLQGIPGMIIRTRPGRGMFLLRMGTSGGDRIEVEVRGHDLEVADALAERVRRAVEAVDGVTDAQISRESGSPEELIRIDRLKAADMKLTVSDIANALQTVLSGSRAGNYREGGDEYPIRVQLRGAQAMGLREILDLTVANAEGQPVVLRNVVKFEPRSGPVMIERKDQQRVVTVSADFAGRDMGSVLADIRAAVAAVPVPQGFGIVFGGDYEEQQEAFRELLLSCVLALVLVYMVMACLYESLRDPFVVMFSVPMATIGVVLMLFLTGTTFNVQSFIGCIMLAGIVVNNAILLVDHTNLLRRRDGLGLREAIEEAGRRRLRPILMTATTTMLALTPLALGVGEGGEAQAPMARAVIGGLLSSTLITLVFVPVVYSIFERRPRESRLSQPAGE